MVANPAQGHLDSFFILPLSPFAPENLVSQDGFGRPVTRQLAHSLLIRLNLVLTHVIHPALHDGVMHTVYRHRASPEVIGSRNCVPVAFIAERLPAQGQ